jgi:fumarate reductase flavoprotein subunit
MDEGLLDNPFESANALMRQPGQVSYTLFDQSLCEEVVRRQANLAAGPVYEAQARDSERFAAQLSRHATITGTLSAAAGPIGCDPAELEETVAQYNDSCDHGHDSLFAKEPVYLVPLRTPPYWILEGRLGFLETLGGIRIDEQMRVLDNSGDPIPGLWAGGADTGGWEGPTYNFKTAGKTLSFALVSGRIAGERAVAYLQQSA